MSAARNSDANARNYSRFDWGLSQGVVLIKCDIKLGLRNLLKVRQGLERSPSRGRHHPLYHGPQASCPREFIMYLKRRAGRTAIAMTHLQSKAPFFS